jgi:hypothetical protein
MQHLPLPAINPRFFGPPACSTENGLFRSQPSINAAVFPELPKFLNLVIFLTEPVTEHKGCTCTEIAIAIKFHALDSILMVTIYTYFKVVYSVHV